MSYIEQDLAKCCNISQQCITSKKENGISTTRKDELCGSTSSTMLLSASYLQNVIWKSELFLFGNKTGNSVPFENINNILRKSLFGGT